jgi:hypothetical protein
MQPIKLKIDVKKINKERLYKGQKGTYLNAVLFLSQHTDDYGNHGMIVEDITKEERDAGVKGDIIGNAKLLMPNPSPAQQQQKAPPPQQNNQEDDTPF